MRRYGQFHLCEDATQEALLAAAVQWQADGIPENPRGWLVTVGARRLMDQVRSEQSRRNREELIAAATPPSTGMCAPVVTDNSPAVSATTAAATCSGSTSRPSRVRRA